MQNARHSVIFCVRFTSADVLFNLRVVYDDLPLKSKNETAPKVAETSNGDQKCGITFLNQAAQAALRHSAFVSEATSAIANHKEPRLRFKDDQLNKFRASIDDILVCLGICWPFCKILHGFSLESTTNFMLESKRLDEAAIIFAVYICKHNFSENQLKPVFLGIILIVIKNAILLMEEKRVSEYIDSDCSPIEMRPIERTCFEQLLLTPTLSKTRATVIIFWSQFYIRSAHTFLFKQKSLFDSGCSSHLLFKKMWIHTKMRENLRQTARNRHVSSKCLRFSRF